MLGIQILSTKVSKKNMNYRYKITLDKFYITMLGSAIIIKVFLGQICR